MKMQCNHCGNIGDFSALRLGKSCGKCHQGKYMPSPVGIVKETKK